MKKSRFIAGRIPVLEAISEGVSIDKIFIQRDVKGKSVHDVVEQAKLNGIPIQYVPPEKIKRLLGPKQKMQALNHQGVLAISSLIQYYDIEDVISFQFEKAKLPFICILDRITDVRNLGAIARSAVAFGVDALVIPKKDSADINEFALKSSAGALEKIHVCRVKDIFKTIDLLKMHGLKILSADMNGEPISECDFSEKAIALILGSEGEGIGKKVISMSDSIVKIPISKSIESLNVSVAAGIMFYEISKLMGN